MLDKIPEPTERVDPVYDSPPLSEASDEEQTDDKGTNQCTLSSCGLGLNWASNEQPQPYSQALDTIIYKLNIGGQPSASLNFTNR